MRLNRSFVALSAGLAVPALAWAGCPADCDGSGRVDFRDLVCGLALMGGENSAADCDGSGGVGFYDLLCVLDRFGPCPEIRPIVMDGSFDDWASIGPDASDPVGDASGAFDLSRVSVESRGTTLFVRFDTNSFRNLQSGSSSDGTLLLRVTGPSGDFFEADMRNRRFSLNDSPDPPFGGEGAVGHATAGFFALPTYASDESELSMDLSVVGAALGDTISVEFSGSDSLDAPIVHALAEPEPAPFEQTVVRVHSTDLRVASLNVLQNGLLDPSRKQDLFRLIRGVDADVYCFQEMWSANATTMQNAMAEAFAGYADGREDAANWTVAIESGAAVATTLPFEVLSVPGSREGGGIVTLADGTRVFVLSVHMKCCGSIGTSEDTQRIQAAIGYRNFIGSLLSQEPGLGVIVGGDYNLVGSRVPLDILTQPVLQTARLDMLNAGARRVTTWRDAGSSFAPGVLDLMVYSDEVFTQARGYVLDTSRLSAEQRARLGVESDDSEASDHLMLVADFVVGD